MNNQPVNGAAGTLRLLPSATSRATWPTVFPEGAIRRKGLGAERHGSYFRRSLLLTSLSTASWKCPLILSNYPPLAERYWMQRQAEGFSPAIFMLASIEGFRSLNKREGNVAGVACTGFWPQSSGQTTMALCGLHEGCLCDAEMWVCREFDGGVAFYGRPARGCELYIWRAWWFRSANARWWSLEIDESNWIVWPDDPQSLSRSAERAERRQWFDVRKACRKKIMNGKGRTVLQHLS
ncbi:hypothetical protein CC80DRAFT_69795 [Byssothecium circinans]|uniref:Uncharacterized protein n=1 Tax=Byssothecium circinans TaxID=147558 RepID=A0A6A5TT62_9PLEO|nr:hypothetical protein CC80DRAFT_69795 [Byssothecium circinans]